jgi:hypothetical protein
MGVAVEYAYAYAAGAGWFGMYLTGQLTWLLPMLLQPEETVEEPGEPRWTRLEFPGQVAGTALATLGLLTGFGPLVALGAALSLAATLSLAIRGVRLCLARPALVAR